LAASEFEHKGTLRSSPSTAADGRRCQPEWVLIERDETQSVTTSTTTADLAQTAILDKDEIAAKEQL